MDPTSKSINSLTTPSRQSPVAILLILLRFFRIIIRQFWPVLLVLLFSAKSQEDNWLAWFTIGTAALSTLLSIIAYFKFYFYLEGNELIIEKGVIQKSKVNIPLDRIQTINFKQNIIHQFFDVVGLEIDTAGSAGKEFSINALNKDRAEAIRAFLMTQRNALAGETLEVTGQPSPEEEELLLRLNPADLLKIGVGQNHFRTVLVILATFFGLYQYLPEGLENQVVDRLREFYGLSFGTVVLTTVITAVTLFGVAFTISLFNTVLRHYDLRFLKTSSGFKVIGGLFTRKERSANLQKIQLVHWSKNPIKKLFGIYDIRLSQAASSILTNQQSIYVPGSYMLQVKAVRNAYLPGESQLVFEKHAISPLIIVRRILYLGGIPALILVLLSFLNAGSLNWIWAIAWVVIIAINSYYYHKKWSYEISEEALRIQRGILTERASLLKWYKVQSVKIRQSLYQRRKHLANIYFYTAGGMISIPYIELDKARALQDYVLYKIESDNRKWM